MKALQRTVALALILGIFSIPAAVASTANGEDQPHMQAALEALRQARQHLQEAAHDKDGHRAAALKAVDDAIKHTEMGIKAGDKHEDKDHDHDHDKH